MRHTGFEGSYATHQSRTGGGAGWADLEVGEARGVFVELVDVRSLDDLVSHAGKISHALVVGDDDDDIGLRFYQFVGLVLRRAWQESENGAGPEQEGFNVHILECRRGGSRAS